MFYNFNKKSSNIFLGAYFLAITPYANEYGCIEE
jgi:hypothetical protein